MKIRVLWPGRIRKEYYRSAAQDYAARIRHLVPFEIVETKETPVRDRAKSHRIRKESAMLEEKRKAPAAVVLDASGKQLSSEEFAGWIGKQSTDIDFLLGGPEGLEIENPALKLSFGRMTFPHELARVLLLEQIYRALTILKRIPYHK
jgi:23S rRNA (pseudouridine1915-N3)-methyltransferase